MSKWCRRADFGEVGPVRARPGPWRGSGLASPYVAAAGLAVAAVVSTCGGGAVHGGVDGVRTVDERLLRLGEDEPDREVGVLVRLARDPGAGELERLAEAGLVVGTAAGRVVTGRIRAGAARRLGGLAIVEYVELADEVPVPRPPGRVP